MSPAPPSLNNHQTKKPPIIAATRIIAIFALAIVLTPFIVCAIYSHTIYREIKRTCVLIVDKSPRLSRRFTAILLNYNISIFRFQLFPFWKQLPSPPMKKPLFFPSDTLHL
nr:MAG TPA_asm: hypothetical protein [Caudoviricetes sp.]